MGILPDHWIRIQADDGMIKPFVENQSGNGVISYGVSSYGYDARVSNKFKIFTNINSTIIDPKDFNENSFVEHEGDTCIIPPNSFALASTVERFKIPRNVMVVCLGKSTYARCGIIVNVTPLEPEWEGHVTLELSNTTPLPAKIYANEGICQFLFFKGDSACEVSYADRKGKYQGQEGITLPKVLNSVTGISGDNDVNSIETMVAVAEKLVVGARIRVKVYTLDRAAIMRLLPKGGKAFSIIQDISNDKTVIERIA